MSDEFPLYPTLSEEAKLEAQQLIDNFKVKMYDAMKGVCEEVLDEFYYDVVPYIESDGWTNFRNELLDGFKNYHNKKIQAKYDFAEIRKAIYENHKEEIINDLNQDLVKEIKRLNEFIRDIDNRRGCY